MRTSLMWRYLSAMVTSLSLGACGGDDAKGGEAKLGSYSGTPAPPAPPALPMLDACPEGFEAVGTTDVPSCQLLEEPEPPRLEETCPPGWQFLENQVNAFEGGTVPMCRPSAPTTRCPDNQRVDLGSGSCVTVGSGCLSGGAWPQALPQGTATVYLRAGAAGNGTAGAPYGNFAQALAATPEGGVLVVGPGTYVVSARIDKPLTIVGTCAEQVVIEGPESALVEVADDPSSIEGTFEVQATGDLRLSNVTLKGRRVGLHVQKEASATVQSVRFDQNTNKAILVDGGSLDLTDTVVERTLPLPDGRKGRGLQVNLGGRATVRNATFQDNDRSEVSAYGVGTLVELSDVVLHNTRISADADGYGLIFADGATMQATRVLVRAKRSIAIAGVTGGELTLNHAYVTGTLPDADGLGMGLRVLGATAHVTNAVFLEQTMTAVYVGGQGVLTGSDISISSTRGHPVSGEFGRGIAAFDDGNVDLERVFVDRSNETGVYINGSEATIRDLTLRGNAIGGMIAEQKASVSITRASSLNDVQAAVIARSGAQLSLADVSVDDVVQRVWRGEPHGVGITCSLAGMELRRVAVRGTFAQGLSANRCDVELVGGVVEDTRADPAANGKEAHGVNFVGGDVKAEGLIVRRSQGAGVVIGGTPIDDPTMDALPLTLIEGSDIVVEDTLATPSGELGTGLSLLEGARGTLARVSISRSHTTGLTSRHDSEVAVSDLTVRDTEPEVAASSHGVGIVTLDGSRLELSRALISDSWSGGIYVSGSLSSISATDLTVRDTKPLKGANGIGVGVFRGAGFTVERGLISRHDAAGLLVQFAGAVKASDLTISDITSGSFVSEDIFGRNDVDGAGDCILALSRAVVDLERVALSGCARVGALFDDASGCLSEVQVQGAPVGVALQGFPRPELIWSSVGANDSATPLQVAGGLLVPATSPPILDSRSKLGNAVRIP